MAEVLATLRAGLSAIELAFSKIKVHLTCAAARTVDERWLAMANALDAVTPSGAQAFFKSCRYDPE